MADKAIKVTCKECGNPMRIVHTVRVILTPNDPNIVGTTMEDSTPELACDVCESKRSKEIENEYGCGCC